MTRAHGGHHAADAGRVIAGAARGTRLSGAGPTVRPFGDRLKEAVFAILEPRLRGAAVLDLFAGTGAAGIEALSRGARAVTFVERDRSIETVLRRNLDRTRLASPSTVVVRSEALAWLAGPRPVGAPWDVVVLDPPYDEPELLRAALERLGRAPELLGRDAVVVAKHDRRTDLPGAAGLLASERVRRFGETTVTFYRRLDPTEAAS